MRDSKFQPSPEAVLASSLVGRHTITLDEAVHITGLTKTFLKEAAGAGFLRTSKPGKRILVYTASLIELIKKAETKKLRVRDVYERRNALQLAAAEQAERAAKKPRAAPATSTARG